MNSSVGISAKGTLVVTRSRIENNSGGGIEAINPVGLDITNTFISQNGATRFGGLKLDVTNTQGMRRLALNTIVENASPSGVGGGGVSCAGDLTAEANIIAANRFNGSSTVGGAQISSGCTFSSSTVVNALDTLMLDSTYHLLPGSPMIDMANQPIAIDFDGDFRPNGGASDVGADEYTP